MAICLTTDDLGWILQIPLEDQVADAMVFQLQRVEVSGLDHFQAKLRKYVGPALLEALDADLKPPIQAQLSYARAISRRLPQKICRSKSSTLRSSPIS